MTPATSKPLAYPLKYADFATETSPRREQTKLNCNTQDSEVTCMDVIASRITENSTTFKQLVPANNNGNTKLRITYYTMW